MHHLHPPSQSRRRFPRPAALDEMYSRHSHCKVRATFKPVRNLPAIDLGFDLWASFERSKRPITS